MPTLLLIFLYCVTVSSFEIGREFYVGFLMLLTISFLLEQGTRCTNRHKLYKERDRNVRQQNSLH